jgi:hypothetical protein
VFICLAEPSWFSRLRHAFPTTPFTFGGGPPQDSGWLSHIWLVEGSARWCTMWWNVFTSVPRALVSITDSSLPSPQGWSQYMLSAGAVGSIVGGEWNFVFRGLEYTVPATLPFQRVLKHILNPADRSQPWSDPPIDACAPRPSEAIARADVLHRVLCPSVFGSNRLVLRALSSAELGRAFDIPTPVACWFQDVLPASLPWLSGAPVKLLLAVGKGMNFRGGALTFPTPRSLSSLLASSTLLSPMGPVIVRGQELSPDQRRSTLLSPMGRPDQRWLRPRMTVLVAYRSQSLRARSIVL